MPNKKKILVVDDDAEIRQYVSSYLSENGFNAYTAENGEAMDAILSAHDIELIILDVTMPGEDGLSICRRLDPVSGPAVVIISAAGEEVDRVLGLEIGADDYLPKPFSPRELLARVRAVIRRRENAALGGPRRGERYAFAGFTYDPAKRQLRAPSDATILLTSGESLLLGLMLSRPRTYLSREVLMAADPGVNAGRGVDIVISRLRKKLEAHSAANIIRTQRLAGYAVDCTVIRT